MLEQISAVSFWDIDNVMIKGYGFTQMEIEKENAKQYSKMVDQNIRNFISVEIVKISKGTRNILNITVGPNHSIENFKNELIENNYLYQGENEYGFLLYSKKNIYFLISTEPNPAGANQIILMPKLES